MEIIYFQTLGRLLSNPVLILLNFDVSVLETILMIENLLSSRQFNLPSEGVWLLKSICNLGQNLLLIFTASDYIPRRIY